MEDHEAMLLQRKVVGMEITVRDKSMRSLSDNVDRRIHEAVQMTSSQIRDDLVHFQEDYIQPFQVETRQALSSTRSEIDQLRNMIASELHGIKDGLKQVADSGHDMSSWMRVWYCDN